jgi:hypothetical protein
VEIHTEDTLIEKPDYDDLFLERTLTATLCGSPDIPKLAEEDV